MTMIWWWLILRRQFLRGIFNFSLANAKNRQNVNSLIWFLDKVETTVQRNQYYRQNVMRSTHCGNSIKKKNCGRFFLVLKTNFAFKTPLILNIMSEQLSRRSFDPAQVFNYYAATRGWTYPGRVFVMELKSSRVMCNEARIVHWVISFFPKGRN